MSAAETHWEMARGQRHTDHVQLADDDEEQVEQDVQHTRDAQDRYSGFLVSPMALKMALPKL